MFIGDGVYVTPTEVKEMRRAPKLVFINCRQLCCTEDRERRTYGGKDGQTDLLHGDAVRRQAGGAARGRRA
jgi:hypothetical protein